jgi:small-conductance mechanosensitive channel
MLNTNQDLQMLATIKDTSVQNKENIDSLRAELAMFSQHLKRLSQLKDVEEPDVQVSGYEQEVLNSVRDKLNIVEQEQEKMVLKSKEDIDKILKNLDEKQVGCIHTCLCF